MYSYLAAHLKKTVPIKSPDAKIFMLKSSNLKFCILLLLISVVGSIFYFYLFRSLKVNCTASQYRVDIVDGQQTFVMILHPEGEGEINYLGSLKDEQQHEFQLSRTIYFNYNLHNANEILMSKIRVVKTISDTTPDVLFNRKVLDLSTGLQRFFFRRIYNAYMISTPYSAIGICVEENQ